MLNRLHKADADSRSTAEPHMTLPPAPVQEGPHGPDPALAAHLVHQLAQVLDLLVRRRAEVLVQVKHDPQAQQRDLLVVRRRGLLQRRQDLRDIRPQRLR